MNMNESFRIGDIRPVLLPYWDGNTKSMKVKSRPAVILSLPHERFREILVLPVTADKNGIYLEEQDVIIKTSQYRKLGFDKNSLIKVGHITQAYAMSVDGNVSLGNIPDTYPSLWDFIIEQVDVAINEKLAIKTNELKKVK